jgi:hypothetical protein
MSLITHLHLLPRLRMGGATSPSPYAFMTFTGTSRFSNVVKSRWIVLADKLTVTHLLKEFPTLHGILKLIIASKRADHRTQCLRCCQTFRLKWNAQRPTTSYCVISFLLRLDKIDYGSVILIHLLESLNLVFAPMVYKFLKIEDNYITQQPSGTIFFKLHMWWIPGFFSRVAT